MNKKIVASVLFLLNSVSWGAEQSVGLSIIFSNLLSENPDERRIRVSDIHDIEQARKVAETSGPNSVVVARSKLFRPSKVMLEMLEMKAGRKVGRQCPLEALIVYEKQGPAALQDPIVKTFIDCFFKGDFKDANNFHATGCCIEGDILYCVYDPFHNPSASRI